MEKEIEISMEKKLINEYMRIRREQEEIDEQLKELVYHGD